MNYFKEAENVLYHRSKLQKALINLGHRRERLIYDGAPKDITGLDPSKQYVSGGSMNDTMSACLDLVEIQKNIRTTESEIKEIDDVLHQLSSEDCELLSLWYIDGLTKDEICAELHFATRKSLYDKRNKAIGEFAILYYGAPALSVI
jgi:hypothetical protein